MGSIKDTVRKSSQEISICPLACLLTDAQYYNIYERKEEINQRTFWKCETKISIFFERGRVSHTWKID
jgi:hypothetical protein